MDKTETKPRTALTLEENLKKALTELLILSLLSEKEHYIGELSPEISRRCGGAINIEFPYAAIYRLARVDYITELKKRFAPDGRLRQYYAITDEGKVYLNDLRETYARFSGAVDQILKKEADEP